MLRYPVPLILYTDSKSLFDSLTVLNAATEKQLFTDLRVLCRKYELSELTKIVWIPSYQNPVDAVTKASPIKALAARVETNKVNVIPKVWIQRPFFCSKYSFEKKRKTLGLTDLVFEVLSAEIVFTRFLTLELVQCRFIYCTMLHL